MSVNFNFSDYEETEMPSLEYIDTTTFDAFRGKVTAAQWMGLYDGQISSILQFDSLKQKKVLRDLKFCTDFQEKLLSREKASPTLVLRVKELFFDDVDFEGFCAYEISYEQIRFSHLFSTWGKLLGAQICISSTAAVYGDYGLIDFLDSAMVADLAEKAGMMIDFSDLPGRRRRMVLCTAIQKISKALPSNAPFQLQFFSPEFRTLTKAVTLLRNERKEQKIIDNLIATTVAASNFQIFSNFPVMSDLITSAGSSEFLPGYRVSMQRIDSLLLRFSCFFGDELSKDTLLSSFLDQSFSTVLSTIQSNGILISGKKSKLQQTLNQIGGGSINDIQHVVIGLDHLTGANEVLYKSNKLTLSTHLNYIANQCFKKGSHFHVIFSVPSILGKKIVSNMPFIVSFNWVSLDKGIAICRLRSNGQIRFLSPRFLSTVCSPWRTWKLRFIESLSSDKEIIDFYSSNDVLEPESRCYYPVILSKKKQIKENNEVGFQFFDEERGFQELMNSPHGEDNNDIPLKYQKENQTETQTTDEKIEDILRKEVVKENLVKDEAHKITQMDSQKSSQEEEKESSETCSEEILDRERRLEEALEKAREKRDRIREASEKSSEGGPPDFDPDGEIASGLFEESDSY